jgi:hypothetical protein
MVANNFLKLATVGKGGSVDSLLIARGWEWVLQVLGVGAAEDVTPQPSAQSLDA